METVTLSEQVDVYRVRKLPRATARWPVIPSSQQPPDGRGGRRASPLPERLDVYRVTQVPGRPLTTSH